MSKKIKVCDYCKSPIYSKLSTVNGVPHHKPCAKKARILYRKKKKRWERGL